MSAAYKFLKGPIKSRRLGSSLGIDLLPRNICSENCIYCECGPTEVLTAERKEYVQTEKVIAELEEKLSQQPACDYITFSGRGEPTLHEDIGEIIDFITTEFPSYRIAVLTNSTLLKCAGVRGELMKADLIVPSLDASRESTFQEVCRPAGGIYLEDIEKGIKLLSEEFYGKIFLEILLMPGINDSPREIEGFKRIIHQIDPDRIDLNSVDRPPVESNAAGMTKKRLQSIARKLPGKIKVF